MVDRLGDIPSWAVEEDDGVPSANLSTSPESNNRSSSANDGEPEDPWGDVEMGDKGTNTATADHAKRNMESFFREIDVVKQDIDTVKRASKRIGEINEEALHATSTDKEKQLSKELQPLVNGTNKRAKQTKTMLGLLKEENEKLKSEGIIKASDLRIRENLINTLTRKFIDEMKLYQSAQQKYKQDIKTKLTRQVKTIKPDATDEEVEAVMKSEGGRDALYKEQILAGGVNDSIQTAYAKVAGKYQDVLTLEQSVAELHQMFLDFALMTEQQGELLDQIEFQVKSAADYVEDANVDLHQSIQFQSKFERSNAGLFWL